jgi:sodium pump decarboxylase gamma subunit
VSWATEWWNQVSGTVLYGFEITVIGMVLVFFTLGLVILAMVLLTRIPGLQAKEQPAQEAAAVASEPPPASAPAMSGSQEPNDLAQIAAIAVAILRHRARVRTNSSAIKRQSAWKHYGRAHQIGL